MTTHYYIEKDGRVFLVEKNGRRTFPTDKKEIPFGFKELRSMPFKDARVVYCEPLIDFPVDWRTNDEIIQMDYVDPLVRRSLWKARPMISADAIIERDGKVLAVKPNRGWTKGKWSLPAGVLTYGESPEKAVEREVREETGMKVVSKRLFIVMKRLFPRSEFWFTCFTFICEAEGDPSPAADEIEDARFLEIKTVIKDTASPFARRALEEFKKDPKTFRILDLD